MAARRTALRSLGCAVALVVLCGVDFGPSHAAKSRHKLKVESEWETFVYTNTQADPPSAAQKKYNDKLKKFVLGFEKKQPGIQKSNIGGYQSDNDLIQNTGPEMTQLRALIYHRVYEYMVESGLYSGLEVVANIDSGWANINRKANSNSPHNHPGNQLSMVYYIDDGGADYRANFCATDARGQSGMVQSARELDWSQMKCIDPRVGKVVIFPSWLDHFVMPYKGPTQRISFAINVQLNNPAIIGVDAASVKATHKINRDPTVTLIISERHRESFAKYQSADSVLPDDTDVVANLSLWPTKLCHIRDPKPKDFKNRSGSLKKALLQVRKTAEGLERLPDVGWTSHYHEIDARVKLPVFTVLRNFIYTSVYESIKAMLEPTIVKTTNIEVTLGFMWTTHTDKGQYHPAHSHPDNHFTGVFVVDNGGAPMRFEAFDPRPETTAAQLVNGSNQVLGYPKSYTLDSGSIMVFPSWLQHSSAPHRGKGTRITVGFSSYFFAREGGAGNLIITDRAHADVYVPTPVFDSSALKDEL